MSDDELELMFENWARWCKDKYHDDAKCKSIEKLYRSPQTWHPPEARAPEVNNISASNVEREVIYLRLSENSSFNSYAAILRGHYVLRAKPEYTCRKAKIKVKEYWPVLKLARLVVRNRVKLNA